MRWAYTIISILILIGAYCFYNPIISNNEHLNLFSYAGTVATIIGLLITVFEIIHAVNRTESIQKQSSALLERVTSIENASSISDCLSLIDETNKSIMQEDYKTALHNFQFFRKICVKIVPEFCNREDKLSSKVNQLELSLHKGTSSTTFTFNKKQKTEMMEHLLDIKTSLETLNPAKRDQK